MKTLLKLFLSLIISFMLIYNTSLADTAWPNNVASIESNSAILIDADSKTLLYGKNIHEKAYPASITKILTALVILENCKLDEKITFSHTAVYNVEKGSSSAGYDEGDTLSVNDALHAMLLKSANEVANALAEHCSGSIEAFAKLMNKKAKELGAIESNFTNPSGLNDENHYTTAYDFALISAAAFKNQTLKEIAQKSYYKLPPSKANPDGFMVFVHHAMLRKNSSNYYPYAIAGKTGYTSVAGNTLVTYASNSKLNLVCVVLGSKQKHYTDTRALLEFGFSNFKKVTPSDDDIPYLQTIKNLNIVNNKDNMTNLIKKSDDSITLPNFANINDTKSNISYDLPKIAPKNALAKIEYTWQDRKVGDIYLISDNLSEKASSVKLSDNTTDKKSFRLILKKFFTNLYTIIVLSLIFIISLIFILLYILRLRRRKKRAKYLAYIRKKRKGFDSFTLINKITNTKIQRKHTDLMKNFRSRKKFK